MTVVGKSWNRLTLPGKVIFTVVPLLIVLTVVAVAAIAILGPTVVDILAANLPIVRFVVAVTVILLITVPTAFLIMLPYVLAFVAVTGLVGRQTPPAALTLPFLGGK